MAEPYNHYVQKGRSLAVSLLSPIEFMVEAPQQWGAALVQWGRTQGAWRQQARQWGLEKQALAAGLQAQTQLREENRQLTALLDLLPAKTHALQAARIRQLALGPSMQEYRLDSGEQQGILSGAPVLGHQGVVGVIEQAFENQSQVLLITDKRHGTPVQTARNATRAIAIGTGETNLIELLHVPNAADIVEGDLLVTSGLGGRFPAGLSVAVIQSVQHEPNDAFAQVTAAPVERLAALSYVAVLLEEGV